MLPGREVTPTRLVKMQSNLLAIASIMVRGEERRGEERSWSRGGCAVSGDRGGCGCGRSGAGMGQDVASFWSIRDDQTGATVLAGPSGM